jgi:DNA-binding Lrp family transcriptional regulator
LDSTSQSEQVQPVDSHSPLNALDRQIVELTQSGMPLTARPYDDLATQLGISSAEVMQRMQLLLDSGVIRRIAVVPNHYRLGYLANGMTVWDVPDEKISFYGQKVGELPFVSHCYHRPRHLPDWSYNLFAMIHGPDRESLRGYIDTIAAILGEDNRSNDVLFSTKILKKTGLRIKSSVQSQ